MNLKTCTKCNTEMPATLEFFYKNAGGKFGVTPRCKACVNEDNKASHEKRMAKNPDHVRALANARAKKSYHGNLETNRQRQCDHQKTRREDPIKGEIIKARKRAGGAGLTPEEVEAIRQRQGNLCAICEDPEPTDLDHCHTSGKVRWLLCTHCNRALGAFRDRPDLMRKAADMLENMEESPQFVQDFNQLSYADQQELLTGKRPEPKY